MLGAIVGRASLGLEPDLEAGLLALGTVLALMWLLQMSPRGSRKQAVPLVVLGVIRADALHRHGLSEADLWSRLRQSGHASLDEVAVALLEPSGQISMIATSSPVDRSALADVRGYDELPAALFAAD